MRRAHDNGRRRTGMRTSLLPPQRACDATVILDVTYVTCAATCLRREAIAHDLFEKREELHDIHVATRRIGVALELRAHAVLVQRALGASTRLANVNIGTAERRARARRDPEMPQSQGQRNKQFNPFPTQVPA